MRPPRRTPSSRALRFLVLASALLAASPALAVVRSWTNAAGGSAGTSTNWSPAALPTAADNLVFPLGGTLTITFPPALVPLVISHDYRTGIYNISTDGTHSTTSSFGVGQSSTCGVNVTGGTFQPFSVYLGTAAGSYGRLTMRTGSGIPTPPPPVMIQTDTTQGGNYGLSGNARLEILGGSLHSLSGPAIFASSAGTRCTLTVAGRNAFTIQNSTFRTTNPRRGTVQFGANGNFVGNIDNGGVLQVAGDSWLALRPGSTGALWIGANTTTFTPSFAAQQAFRIGDTGFAGSGAGAGDFRLYKGTAVIGGPCTLGDPDGNSNASRIHVEGGLLRLSGGFTRTSGTYFTHLGGIVHFDAGAISWPFPTWQVNSSLGSPELWITNGLTTTMGGLDLGRGGSGLLRVARPNTRVNIQSVLVLGDSTSGSGSLVVDSSAVVAIQSQLVVGHHGTGRLTVRNGAHLEPAQDLSLGVFPGSSATAEVSGVGTQVTMASTFEVGGFGGPGGPSSLTVDSSAVLQVTGVSGWANVRAGTGTLAVRNGAAVHVPTLYLDGVCSLDAATLDVGQTQIGASGRLEGRGHVTGAVWSSGGVVSLVPPAGALGRLNVDGNVVLSTGGLAVALGRGAGPRCDTLVCGGSLGLGGTLALSADPSFLRVVGDQFVVATSPNVFGSFSNVTWNGAPGAALFDVIVEPTRVVVVTKAATLGVDDTNGRPGALRFRSVSTASRLAFALELPADADVRVTLLDVSGREVARLHDGRLAAGAHTLSANAAALPGGVYFARALVVRDGVTSVRTAKAVHLR